MFAKREKAKKKLAKFLKNPGYFSVLLLGNSGVGKEYLLKEIIKKEILFYYPFEIGESIKEISKIFKNNVVVIKNIEELSDNQQNILFKALSTENGKIGLKKNKGLKRIIFTSSFNVEQLRESKEFISDRFWDRISQLIVKVPSFQDEPSTILNDFKSVWKRMNFKEYHKLPEDGEFQYWLKTNCSSFSGNFRDLDTIAILWHQYRIIKYPNINQKFRSDIEAKIFRKVKYDFEKFSHYPEQKADISNAFVFKKGQSWKKIESDFKSTFKAWAKKEYNTIKNATENLDMPLRKMDKW